MLARRCLRSARTRETPASTGAPRRATSSSAAAHSQRMVGTAECGPWRVEDRRHFPNAHRAPHNGPGLAQSVAARRSQRRAAKLCRRSSSRRPVDQSLARSGGVPASAARHVRQLSRGSRARSGLCQLRSDAREACGDRRSTVCRVQGGGVQRFGIIPASAPTAETSRHRGRLGSSPTPSVPRG